MSEQKRKYHLETLAVHAGQEVPESDTKARNVPVYRTTAFNFDNSQHGADLFALKVPGNIYARLMNPTNDALEKRLAALEGGVAALTLSSGTAAVYFTITNIAKCGDEIVSANNLYGGTFTQFDAILPQQGITVRFTNLNDFDAVEAAINEKTRLVYIETVGNPTLGVADIEKYAHITFFFNGSVEKQSEGEDRCLVSSPKEFATYDLVPQMSAEKVADKCIEAIASDEYALIVCNFANCDMVGHTGVMEAAVKAVETVDACMGRIMAEVSRHHDTVLLVTADHGNAECIFDESGRVNTAHTTNRVPFAVCMEGVELKDGKLADIAPTILKIMGLSQPEEMTGECLIK